ncbi:hypothetical protein V6000_007966 [Aspergillus fumigatus]|uniref:Calcium uniporter protein n=2 Tax=Aspergillus fumigatus TaxID=746128 RepID=Q4WPS7_ASPFU|nr:conserved hypothetical protein [Aspergillus fumigatus Af293]EAL89757.1 conserved hypothetical protein [Aspergillus fumigatus Af293]EDP50403.1 conserved hypothetical protein [Aspergillus fumigatus A1163]KMK54761.1 hypothetical protein Y699_06405 [Aspergillus fumigatus Z5]
MVLSCDTRMRALVRRIPIAAALRSATVGSQCTSFQDNILNILDRLPQPLQSRSFRIQYTGVSTSGRATQTGRRNFQLSARSRDKRGPQSAEPDPLERLEVRKVQQRHEDEEDDSGRDTKSGGKVAKAMTKGDTIAGKLLTTPSRLFKLLIPLTTINRKDVEQIAILIHPQQPLSHLERLIQSEVPPIEDENGQKKPPAVSFIALQLEQDAIRPKRGMYEGTDAEIHRVEGGKDDATVAKRGEDFEEVDETFSYLRRPEPGQGDKEQRFIRWSQSTEIGDFIRDAARAKEFIVTIEGAPAGLEQIHVAVPSFDERTYFLRMRLRKISGRIQGLAEIKHECDALAHRGAQRVALGGFGILAFWWYIVYKLTFETDLGWDTMEPVTYLVSLSTLMGGYLWFLYHNREISYRSALDFTINARQKKLYQMKGIDLQVWESLIDEANAIRREIKNIAAEYDVDWDERKDEQDDRVTEALKKERRLKNGSQKEERPNDDRDDD